MAQQQYSYGYGYQPTYAYPQAAAPAGYVSYAAARPAYTPAPPTIPPPTPPPPPPPQQQPVQQPSVGYSPYNPAQNSPSNQSYATPQQGSSPATYGQGPKLEVSPASPYSQPQAGGYQNYAAYKPQAPSYTPYYESIKAQTTSTFVTASQTISAIATGTTTYVPTYTLTTTADSGGSMVGYPSFTQTSYASAANAYYKQMKDTKTSTAGQTVGYQPPQTVGYQPPQTVGYQPPQTVGYRPPQTVGYQPQQYTATPTTSANLTPVQQQVVQQYIHQKNQGPGYMKKKPYTPSPNVQAYYCEVCKISCASALTYKTHLDGKSHKKKLNQQKLTTDSDKINRAFYCELCDVVCSNKDGLEAHMRGSKHTKVVNLYKKMGKPIPTPATSMPSGTTSGTAQKPVMVTAPRISFVGGKQLSSTGIGYKEAEVKVYPPAPPTSTSTEADVVKTTPTATPTTKTNGSKTVEATDNSAAEEAEPEPVGEHLVIAVSGDPKFPHASFKCELCDCYFNDEFAKKAHVKGRRHRLNYKKAYQPSLYVEPTKSMKKEIDKKKKQREMQRDMIGELRKLTRGRGGRGRGGWRGGRGSYYNPGNYNSEWGGGDFGSQMVDSNERRRQETLDKARHQEQMRLREEYEEMYPPGPPPMGPPPGPPHMMGPMQPPRDPHDDKLVLSKHNAIYPVDAELTAVDGVVNDVEKALKLVSDDLLTEECKGTQSKSGEESVQKDESKRVLKGVMRVGAFARGLLLKGECDVELILMTSTKPDISLFQLLDSRIPAKFEELKKSGTIKNTYNVTPNCTKAVFIVIAQVEEYRIQVSVTLTSTTMREEPSPEQAKTDEAEGVLDRPSCLAALAALRHTKWFQAMAHSLPSCIIAMRVLKDICRRVPAWGVLDTWIMQLLVQKSIVSANSDFTKPGDVFRRVMECVASGLFLPGGAGLGDPCEKGIVDASANLTAQERANITLSAQHALRLIAFDKLHLVLGVEPLPLPGSPSKPVVEEASESEETSVGTKRDASSPGSSESCKKIKLE